MATIVSTAGKPASASGRETAPAPDLSSDSSLPARTGAEIARHLPEEIVRWELASIGRAIELELSGDERRAIRRQLRDLVTGDLDWAVALDGPIASPNLSPLLRDDPERAQFAREETIKLWKTGSTALFSALVFQEDPYRCVRTAACSPLLHDRIPEILEAWLGFTPKERRSELLDIISARMEWEASGGIVQEGGPRRSQPNMASMRAGVSRIAALSAKSNQ